MSLICIKVKIYNSSISSRLSQVDLSRELYTSVNSTVYMGTIGSKQAVVKVTRSKIAESVQGENREEAIMQDLSVSTFLR